MRHEVIELQGRIYETKKSLCGRLGISMMGLECWKRIRLLPDPVKVGKAHFYDRAELEARLTRQQ